MALSTGLADRKVSTGNQAPYAGAPDDYRRTSLAFRHSMVALAPEWEPSRVEVLEPLGAEIVARGNDPIVQGMTDAPWRSAQRG